jgi:pectinesterase
VLAFAGALGSAPAALAAPESPRVILAGDSTMAPRTGYGDALCGLFVWQVDCLNLARGGRSTKSFRADGSWDRVSSALRERGRPTFVLIQFGHNDQPGKPERTTDLAREFPENLARYVAEVRAAGAVPVLVTPLTRRGFRGDGTLDDNLEPWAAATRRVAHDEGVTFLDLHAVSVAAVSRMGPSKADALAMAPPPARDFDRTHLGPKGAALFARLVARQIAQVLPSLAAHFAVGAVEPPGLIARPQLTAEQARGYSYSAVLGDWDPLAEARESVAPDFVVAGSRIQDAVDAAVAKGGTTRVRILVKPGTYDEIVKIPEAPMPITLYGEGADARAVVIRGSPTAVGNPVVRVRNRGFRAANLTIVNGHNKDRGDRRDQTQGVALMLDDADRAHLENVRLIGFQDTLHLSATSATAPARAFLDRVYVEGDMDFIFGEATAYFRESEIRTLGDRAISYTLAPSTHRASRHGFVFERCRFTHDGSANARAGVFKLARQWTRGPDFVGKVAILHSSIGEHIDAERPWADWSIGTPRYRPVQYEYLAEFENRWETPGAPP